MQISPFLSSSTIFHRIRITCIARGAILKDRSFLFKKSRDEASFVYNSSLEKSAVETIEMVCESYRNIVKLEILIWKIVQARVRKFDGGELEESLEEKNWRKVA